MPVAASNAQQKTPNTGVWQVAGWAGRRIAAGTIARHHDVEPFLQSRHRSVTTVAAEQVHGSGIAAIGRAAEAPRTIPGCDALVTQTAGIALLIRTADCLPIFVADPSRGIVGLAHAGWRGLVASLPIRMLAAFRRLYHARAEELSIAIGPSIRACCYEVGPDVAGQFAPFLRTRNGRRTCDLVGAAREQLRRGGVREDRIVESPSCTSCDRRWYSRRRDGAGTGRLTSFILRRP